MIGYFAWVRFVYGTTRLGVGANERSVAVFDGESASVVVCALAIAGGITNSNPRTNNRRHLKKYSMSLNAG
ncbi:MAG: hypothetical protein ACKVHR_03630 [Pirellulales bacterium]